MHAAAPIPLAADARVHHFKSGNVTFTFVAAGTSASQDSVRCGHCESVLQRRFVDRHKAGRPRRAAREGRAGRPPPAAAPASGAAAPPGFDAVQLPDPVPAGYACTGKRDRSLSAAMSAAAGICPHCNLSLDLPFCPLRGIPHRQGVSADEEDAAEAARVASASASRDASAAMLEDLLPDLGAPAEQQGACPPSPGHRVAAREHNAAGHGGAPAPSPLTREHGVFAAAPGSGSALERQIAFMFEAQRERDARFEERLLAQNEQSRALVHDILNATCSARSGSDKSRDEFPVLWPADDLRSDLPRWEAAAAAAGAPIATKGLYWAYRGIAELHLGGVEDNAHVAAAACCVQQAVLALAGGDPLSPTPNPACSYAPQPTFSAPAPGASLLPAYMTGAAADPPKASRDELGQALQYANANRLQHSGAFFTYSGSNRRWYVAKSGNVCDASVTPVRQCANCRTRHWAFDPCPA
eukprot:gene9417-753_t